MGNRVEPFGLVRHTPGFMVGGTVEVISTKTGITQIPPQPCIFPDPLLGPPGQNAGVFVIPGTVGIVKNQLARLSIFNHVNTGQIPPTPCNIVASIFKSSGELLAETKLTDALGPNEGTSIDFNHPGGKQGLGNRVELYGQVRHTPGHMIGGTLETINAKIGKTLIPPIPCNFPDPAL